jgi:cell division inhibitor SepF
MSFFENIKRMISPISDEDDDYDEIFDDRDSPFVDDRPRSADRNSAIDRGRGKVVNIHATTQLKVVLVKPERFEAASEIADHLKEKRTVVVNLESTHKDIARRLIDFLSGVAYAGEGKIKKVAANTYIITPYSVDIQGDLIDELESNGMYF